MSSGTARAMVFTEVGKPLQMQEFDVPEPKPDEILVRVHGCTLCGSDLHTLDGRRSVAVPMILGHEILGRIVVIGSDVATVDSAGTPIRIGDRITWSMIASCGRCYCCHRGLPQKCERMVKYGHEQLQTGRVWTGGLADYCLLSGGTAVMRVPDELSSAVVCPVNCATATIAAACEAAGDLFGRNVLVLGAGMLGLTACAMARSLGANEVICVDANAERLTRADRFGATRVAAPHESNVIQQATAGRGVDVAFELSGSPAACEQALSNLALMGRLVLVGAVFPTRPVPLQMEQVIRRHLTLVGIHNYAPSHLQSALKFLVNERAYPLESLVSQWLPLAEANHAVRMARDPSNIRIGIHSDD